MNVYFYVLVLLVGFTAINSSDIKSTATSPIAKDFSEMSIGEVAETLITAVEKNNESLVCQILAHPASKNISEYKLMKALEKAAENNYLDIARRLIQAGANIKDRYCYALQHAAEKGYTDMIKELLPVSGCDKINDGGFHLNELNFNRDRGLIEAAANGHVDVMKELINAGANANIQDNFGRKPIVEAAKKGHAAAVKVLIQAKADVNGSDGNGMSALPVAVHLHDTYKTQVSPDMKDAARVMRLRNLAVIRELLKSPRIDVSWYIREIQEGYESYLKKPDWYKEQIYDEIEVQFYELFKPFMEL